MCHIETFHFWRIGIPHHFLQQYPWSEHYRYFLMNRRNHLEHSTIQCIMAHPWLASSSRDEGIGSSRRVLVLQTELNFYKARCRIKYITSHISADILIINLLVFPSIQLSHIYCSFSLLYTAPIRHCVDHGSRDVPSKVNYPAEYPDGIDVRVNQHVTRAIGHFDDDMSISITWRSCISSTSNPYSS